MPTFSTDIDLLHWEPNILKDAEFASQTLLQSTADLSETTLSLLSGSLVDAQVEAGQAVYVGGAINGSFPIVTIDSPTQLTLSILYDKLYDAPPTPGRGGPDATGVSIAIRTFWAQRQVVTELLLHAAGLTANDFAKVLNPQSLKRACVLGTLQMIYNALAAAAAESSIYAIRAALYEKLYRRALRSARVELDLNGDGKTDCVRKLNTLELIRG